MTSDDIKTLLSILAFGTSIASLVLTRINWRQSNRPVVSAFIVEHTIGDGVATFNLSIANTGSRPATNVRLDFQAGELEKLIDPKASSEAKMRLAGCFGRDSTLPLVRNGEIVTGGLGYSSRVPLQEPQLLYGAEATVKIVYFDLECNRYESIQPLKVFAREGFTGYSWQSAV